MLKENSKEIKIPDFVNVLSDEAIINLAKEISQGNIKIYTEEKKKTKTVGYRRVYTEDTLINDKELVLSLYNIAIQKYKNAKKNLSLIKMLQINSEKIKLKKQFDIINKSDSYVSYITDSDEEPSLILCKEDLAQTARDIKPFQM